MYTRSCKSWRQKREVLTVKHQNNIPYYEAHKLVVGSKTTTYSQAVRHNKSPSKYETIVKAMIQLEPGDWESFINKIKALLVTTRAADKSTTSVDLAENKVESSAPNTDLIGENWYWGENGNNTNCTAIKHPVTKSPTKIRSKDPQYDFLLLQTPLQTKKHLKIKKNLPQNKKYKSQKL